MGIGCCGKKPTGKDEMETPESDRAESVPKASENLSKKNCKASEARDNHSNPYANMSLSYGDAPEGDTRDEPTVPVDCLVVPPVKKEKLPEVLSGDHISNVSSAMLAGLISKPRQVNIFHHSTDGDFRRSSTNYNLSDYKGPTYKGLMELNFPKSSPQLTTGLSSWTQNKNNSPSQILPSLWLGTKMDSTDDEKLKKLGITHILSVTSGKQHEAPNCELLSVPMADNGNTDLLNVTAKAFPFIEESQRGDNRLLIHCNHGQNRSPTVVIAWLMKKERKYDSLFKAYTFVKSKRGMVQPHKSYIKQLRDLDLEINKIYSTPDNFLTMSLVGSTLDIAHEGMSADDSSRYIRSQLDVMSTEQLETYKSHKKLVESDDDDSTYESVTRSSKVLMPLMTEDTELVPPQLDVQTGREGVSTHTK